MLTLTTNNTIYDRRSCRGIGSPEKKCKSLEKDNASLKETNRHSDIKLAELKTAGPQLLLKKQTYASWLSAAQWSGILMPINCCMWRSSVSQEVTSKMYMIICASRTELSRMLRYLLKAMTVRLGPIQNQTVEANRLTEDVRVATVIPRIPRENRQYWYSRSNWGVQCRSNLYVSRQRTL